MSLDAEATLGKERKICGLSMSFRFVGTANNAFLPIW